MSFEDYAARRGPYLLRLAYLLCGDADRAQDLVQSALVDAYRNWDRIRRAEHPDAYVRRIMINTLLASQRRRSWWERPTASGTLPEPAPGRWGPNGDPADPAAARDAVRRLLHRLPPRARAVLVLRYFDDADDATIGALLGMAPSSVRSTASRALANLRSSLADSITWEVS